MAGRARPRESVLGSSAAPLRLLGLWSAGEEDAGRAAGLLTGSVALAVICGATIISLLKLLMDRPRELEELVACIFVVTMHSEIFIKTVCFVMEGSTLRQLIQLLSEMRGENSVHERQEEIRLRYQRLGDRVFVAIMGMTMVTASLWMAAPLAQQVVSGPRRAPRLLPLPAWLPLDIYASPTFQLLYAAQVLFIPLVATITICCDCVFIDLMLRVAAELHILNDSVSGLRKIDLDATAATRNECKSIDVVSDDEINLRLVKSVKHHQAIMKSVALLEKAMSTPIFVLFVSMMIAICADIFAAAAILRTDEGTTKAAKLILALPPLLYDVGVYCTFGQIITDQSEKLMHSAYSCGWVDCDARFRRSLLTFSMGARRPLEITVGSMYKLSKETFLQVLHGSYAMFNMLYGCQSNK